MKGLNDIPVCTVLEKINLVERLLSDEETVTYVKSAEEIRSIFQNLNVCCVFDTKISKK